MSHVEPERGGRGCPECAAKQEIIKRSCEEWAEDDTAIKELAKPFGVDVEGDGYAFKTMVEVVEDLCALLTKYRNALKEFENELAAERREREQMERCQRILEGDANEPPPLHTKD